MLSVSSYVTVSELHALSLGEEVVGLCDKETLAKLKMLSFSWFQFPKPKDFSHCWELLFFTVGQ